MAQFSIYQNRNLTTRNRFPYLLDVQILLLESLETRLVIPLMPIRLSQGKAFTKLTPLVKIENQEYLVHTPLMAGILKNELGPFVSDVSYLRQDIISAIDLLITGI